MKVNLENIPYDILDNIINKLDVSSTINLLMVSKDIYEKYVFYNNKHYKITMINKIIKYFTSLNKLKIDCKVINIEEMYKYLNKIYYCFNKHVNTSLSDILIYLCDAKLSNKWIFKHIISHCYFPQDGSYAYNTILADDLIYLLMFIEDITVITKYIFIEPIIIKSVIKYKIQIRDRINILALFNYLLFTHFFRTSEYMEDIITDIVCYIIKMKDMAILYNIYNKQKIYKFKLNYQKIINVCIERKDIELLDIINKKMCEQNYYNPIPLIITKESIRFLMKTKSYTMLTRVIELYLKDMINLNSYVNEILFNFDYNNVECKKLLNYLNDKNKLKFKIK